MRLEQQAAEVRLISPKKKSTFWEREIRPLFVARYKGSSSEEEDDDEAANIAKGKEVRKKIRQQKRLEKSAMKEKLEKDGL
jgi:hypothetical protein